MVGSKIANNGQIITLNRTWKPTPDFTAPSVFKIGIGTTNPTITDTDLQTPVPITGQETVDNCDALNAYDTNSNADATCTLNTSTKRVGTGAINLTKDAGASANANTFEDTTNLPTLNFDDKKIEFFLYIDDQATLDLLATTDCLTVRYGSDSTNYYQWTRDKSQLIVGWNYINNMTDDNEDSITGTPVNASSDFFFIQITTTLSASTWAAGKVIFDDVRLTEAADLTKIFVAGFPLLDETNFTATIRGLLTINDAIGQILTEFGLFNTDTVAKMFSRATYTAFTKDNATQVIYLEKDVLI